MSHRSAGSHPRAFSLAEAMVATAVCAVLALGMGGALVIAAKATPSRADPNNAASRAREAAELLASELSYATSIIDTKPNSIRFNVADRDEDGQEEEILYEWPGTGSPLERSINGGNPARLVDSVADFTLGFSLREKQKSSKSVTEAESGEVLLASFEGWPGVVPIISQIAITSTGWGSENFRIDRVSLPSTTTSLAISRVRLKLRKTAALVTTTVSAQLYQQQPGDTLPGKTTLGSPVTILANGLPTSFGAWIDFDFRDATLRYPWSQFCVLVTGTGTTGAQMQHYSGTDAPVDNSSLVWTTNGGSSWSPSLNPQRYETPFEVYGSYTYTAVTETITTTQHLASFTVSITSSGSPTPDGRANGRLLSEPEVAP